MKYEKMSDFISFSFFGLILVIKLRSFDLESHWNFFYMSWLKNDVRFEYFPSNGVWFGLRLFVRVELWQ